MIFFDYTVNHLESKALISAKIDCASRARSRTPDRRAGSFVQIIIFQKLIIQRLYILLQALKLFRLPTFSQ